MSTSLTLPVLRYADADFTQALNQLLQRAPQQKDELQQIENQVRDIIKQVHEGGDESLFELTERFDNFDIEQTGMEVPAETLAKAAETIPAEQKAALDYAAERIRKFHQRQLQESWQYTEPDGTVLGQKMTPIERVGLYVPGGKAAYPSSVLMNAIPAKVAGVRELIMVSPTPEGELNQMVVAAAHIAGVDRVLRIGGAQAVAALAFGTESIPAVDKITGPGNIYVATAKRQVFGKVGIDMIAGPSEVLVIADQSVNPDWVAMDLFAQAEHDEDAQAILLTRSEAVASQVQSSIDKLIATQARQQIITASMVNNSAIIVVDSDEELIKVANTIAAEHLEIFTENAEELVNKISHAGAIFIGPYSAEAMGDYCAGPNHVLPTSDTARFSSPLGVYDFQKRSSIMQISAEGAESIGRSAKVLAQSEGLMAHAQSAEFRLKQKP